MYESLTQHLDEIRKIEDSVKPVLAVGCYDQPAVFAWTEDLYKSGLADEDYVGTLERGGINLDEGIEADAIAGLDSGLTLTALTWICRGKRFCEGSLAEAVACSLVGNLLEHLKAIDPDRA